MNKNNYFSTGRGSRTRGGVNSFFDEPSKKSVSGVRKSGGYKNAPKRRLPLWIIIAADVLAAALILLLFYFINYEWQGDVDSEPLSTPSQAVVSVSPTATPAGAEPSPTVATSDDPAPVVDMTVWRNKFEDKFTNGEVEKTETSYRSANVSVNINRVEDNGVVYFVADIYVADIKYLKTAFGQNKQGKSGFVYEDLKAKGGVIGINGDNCWNNPCLLIRNGVYYKKWSKSSSDALVMYNDGTMKTISAKDFDFNSVKAEAPYQVWGFGPMLLDSEGQPMTKFNTSVSTYNPRTAIGYYEPGHYCFVVVDGRQSGYSKGYNMKEMSELMYKLGCKAAFNLDGGQSSQMAFMGKTINKPSGDRRVNDMIYITDIEE